MRILVSCLQSPIRHPLPAYDFWREYFLQGLQEAGHEVLEVPKVDWAEGCVHRPGDALEAWRSRTWEIATSFVRRELSERPIDLFLSLLFPPQVDVSAIKEIQRLGIPCVNFFCDAVREFRTVPAVFAPFDLHWIPDCEAEPIYRAAGLPYVRTAYPCWVPAAQRSVPATETEPPTFIGRVDVLRREMFGCAIEAGADIILRGPGWRSGSDPCPQPPEKPNSLRRTIANQVDFVRCHGIGGLVVKFQNRVLPVAAPVIPESRIKSSVSNAEYIRISREAMVTIGINRVPTLKAPDRRPLYFGRLRDIEAPMLGACYLTEWTTTVGELYDVGKEVEVYRTPEELAEKIADLSRYPGRRRDMRRRAQQRALNDHTLGRSVAFISQRLGLPTQ